MVHLVEPAVVFECILECLDGVLADQSAAVLHPNGNDSLVRLEDREETQRLVLIDVSRRQRARLDLRDRLVVRRLCLVTERPEQARGDRFGGQEVRTEELVLPGITIFIGDFDRWMETVCGEVSKSLQSKVHMWIGKRGDLVG